MQVQCPRMRAVDGVVWSNGATVFDRNGKRYELTGIDESRWKAIFERMDGTRTIGELCRSAKLDESALHEIIDRLRNEGVINAGVDEPERWSGKEFWSLHDQYCRGWLDRIAGHPIWPALASGTAQRAVAVGFVIEKYHYIEGAHEHMAFAVANADPRIGRDLIRHFQEEYSHGELYLAGLTSLLPRESVVRSLPLPSTRALLNLLNELAQSDSLAYYSANEFLQKTENDEEVLRTATESFYTAIERAYALPAEICESMRRHTRLDQALGHADVFREMCEKLQWVERAEVNRYIGATRRVVEHLEYFLDGIQIFYEARPYFPRPSLSICNV
jgi:pyrroloquinoline quinone (PQQ) biosynthesis protein C